MVFLTTLLLVSDMGLFGLKLQKKSREIRSKQSTGNNTKGIFNIGHLDNIEIFVFFCTTPSFFLQNMHHYVLTIQANFESLNAVHVGRASWKFYAAAILAKQLPFVH